MKPVFSCSFELSLEKQSAQAAFESANVFTRKWISDKYARDSGAPTFGFGNPIALTADITELKPMSEHLIVIDKQACSTGTLQTIVWEHPGDEPSEYWHTRVILAHDQFRASATIHTQIGTRHYSLRPISFQAGIPGIVRELLHKLKCSLNSWPMPAEEYPVPQGRVESFVQSVLLAPQRTLPVLVISRDVWREKINVNPQRWAKSLAGLAEVAVLENKWAGFQFTDQVGKTLSCYDGAVRIYWPGFTLQSSPDQHRLWLPHEIQLTAKSVPLEKRLLGFLCAISATNHVDAPLAAQLRRTIDDERSSERTAAIESARKQAKEPEEYNALISLYSEENKNLRDEKAMLAQQLAEMQIAVEEARREIAIHRENYLALNVNSPAIETSPTVVADDTSHRKTDFSSVLEAYDAALADFGKNDSPLTFLDSARKSAADSPYKSPEEVYFLIQALYEAAKLWRSRKGSLGTSWEEALAPTGFSYSNKISQTAAGKYSEEYSFLHKGKKRLFEQHITKGAKTKNACFSLHMYRDDERLCLVIGHCGNHLSNTST